MYPSKRCEILMQACSMYFMGFAREVKKSRHTSFKSPKYISPTRNHTSNPRLADRILYSLPKKYNVSPYLALANGVQTLVMIA